MPSSSRRQFLRSSAVGSSLALVASGGLASQAFGQLPRADANPAYVAQHRQIRQSIMGWCFRDHFDAVTLARHCKSLGIVAMEGVSASAYPAIRKLGLDISLVGSHGFSQGPCNPEFRDLVVAKLHEGIDLAASIGTKNVITFTGMRFDGMEDEVAAEHCIAVWKSVLSHAEKQGVTLVLEHLNSRDDSHPMKGHPGYFGDDVDFCFDLIRRVGSENFKLLFDIYHVSVMNGDVIRRIRNNHELIGHYHTAGNPGRAELDDTQEINYPAILREILKTDYEGYVAQEFIPTWDDPLEALRHAVQVCDVRA